MAASKAPAAPLHDLPASVDFTLADGTRLTAALRISARARRARLSLLPRGGLVLAIPLGMGPDQLKASLPLFVPWLERAQRSQLRALPAPHLPAQIHLPLTGETFTVLCAGDMAQGRKAASDCMTKPGRNAAFGPAQCSTVRISRGARRVLLVENAGLLRLFGTVDDTPLCAQALRQWARNKAALLLPPYLEQLAASAGFALAGVSVRDQRGRWGSCSRLRPQTPAEQRRGWQKAGRSTVLDQISARVRSFFSTPPEQGPEPESSVPADHSARPRTPEGRISLNWRALLLPPALLDHLCWHELCHLRHMNHSAAYRAELARFSPNWPQHEKALNTAWRGLPWWALPGDDDLPAAQPTKQANEK